jgi:penicillin-binding protein 2
MSVRLGYTAKPGSFHRFALFALAIVIAFTTLGSRMVYLQVVKGRDLGADYAAENTAIQLTPSSRGLIFDRAGRQLVRNVLSYSINVVPNDLPLPKRAEVVGRLADLIGLDPGDISTAIDSATGSLYQPVKVAGNVPVEVARAIEEATYDFPGVSVTVESRRQYLEGPLFGQLVGYTGPISAERYQELLGQGYSATDTLGLAGLEASYERQLRGQYGKQKIVLDEYGRPILGLVTPISPSVPGASIQLSIDTKEQEMAQKALAWGLKESGATKGVIIAMNPQNGEILAMVSLPGYDDNLFANGISDAAYKKLIEDPNTPLVNKAIGEQYAPGSTFKLVTGTAGLQDKKITAYSRIQSKPYVQIGAFRYWEWNHAGWGSLNVIQGLAHSSDTFFYQLSQKVGLDRLTYWAQQYGFGSPTGIDLPGEASGIVPTNKWKLETLGEPMYTGEILQAGIGQGYDASTVLQLLNAYCALANGGKLYQPHIVRSIIRADGQIDQIQPVLIRKLPASSQTLQTMRLATRAVVTSRHTYNLVDLPIKVAGKTGTAEFGVPDQFGRLPYHEWFVGYTAGNPYRADFAKADSKLAVVAFIYGANTLGDASTEVVKYYLAMHYGLQGDPFSSATPGYVLSYLLERTNFYGTANNH